MYNIRLKHEIAITGLNGSNIIEFDRPRRFIHPEHGVVHVAHVQPGVVGIYAAQKDPHSERPTLHTFEGAEVAVAPILLDTRNNLVSLVWKAPKKL